MSLVNANIIGITGLTLTFLINFVGFFYAFYLDFRGANNEFFP